MMQMIKSTLTGVGTLPDDAHSYKTRMVLEPSVRQIKP